MNQLKKREEIKQEDKWNIQELYENDQSWEQDYQVVAQMVNEFTKYKGTLDASSKDLYRVLDNQFEIEERFERIYVYANQKYHEDTSNAVYQAMSGKASSLLVEVNKATSFVEPELLRIPEDKLKAFFENNSELHLYTRYVWEKLRMKKHILSEEMESVLAKVQEIAKGPETIFSMFNNADIEFGTIVDANGQEVQLTHGRYVSFLESYDRRVRKDAFTRMYAQYAKFKNTLAATMNANVQKESFYAKMRAYGSTLEAALDGGNIPVSVYDTLIETVHGKLDLMYQYIELRKKSLQVQELHMYDLYVPMVGGMEKTYTFDEAKEMVKDGLAVLGTDYLAILEEGFESGWIDTYENQGKRSGAYSWGAYGAHPFVLLNYNGSLNHVFTLAHEMGHALHSYHSDAAQEYPYAGYKIFVAEVASTCNEALLIHYLLENAKDPKEKAYLINHFLDQFKGTLFRQTMFAEFEKIVHGMVEQGQTLTADALCKIYYDLNVKYYGTQMVVDQDISMEWARIPHFYNSFYVYQYATGFSAAIAISKKILDGEEGIIEKYKEFLSGGSSMDPIDLLKICGVDMTTRKPVEDALEVFEYYLKELESTMNEQ